MTESNPPSSFRGSTYRSRELLYQGPRSLVFRGERATGEPVLIKQLRGLYPEPADVTWSRREYDILRKFAGPGVLAALDFSVQDGLVWLILEHFDGTRLSDSFFSQKHTITDAIDIAMGVVGALAHLHDSGVIHKSLSPESVLWHRATGQIRLVDLAAASTVHGDFTSSQNLVTSDADLHFIAPEQTGRMNRAPDYRSDYYSLGCVLCWLLTGMPPFAGDDALELVHAHIARQPISPSHRDSSIPSELSQIVLTLLAKRAEDRYQSAEGILNDLKTCRSRDARDGTFVPRSRDIQRTFLIAEHLYGREPELGVLRAACDRIAAGGREILLVSGHPGIGKTALVQEVLEPATHHHANLVSGKFDQVNRGVPYASLVQAIRQFFLRIFSSSAAVISGWREKIQRAVGENGRAITELIQEVELVIGPQAALEPVQPEDARRRLELVFRRFVHALASAENPLILFLDDLQWADLASLRLVEALILDPDVTHLLVIGAFRDTEVGPSDPLSRTLDTIRAEGARVGHISLGALASSDIKWLLLDTLHGDSHSVAALARVCESKTGGNPFYLRRFLREVHADGLVRFEKGRWCWDLEAIERQSVTENVVSFMSRQLHRLPEEARIALQFAACIGTTFDLHTLAALLKRSYRQTQMALEPALARDLVHALDDQYWLGEEDIAIPDFLFAFAHDRVQEAAHESLTLQEQNEAHLAIGRILLHSSTERQLARRLFDIVGHMNQAIALIDERSERLRLAELNLLAGRRALASAAYTSAHHCLQVGVGLLDADAWKLEYQLTLDLHVAAAQAAYLATDDTAMDRLVGAVTNHAVSQLDRLRAQEILVYGLIARNNLHGAVHKALDLLDDLGFSLPRAPAESDIVAGLVPLMTRLSELTPEAIAALPELDNPRVDVARKLMTGVASAAYLAVPSLLPLLAFKVVHSSLDDGISRDSAYGFALLALVLAAIKNVNAAYANGRLAMMLLSRWEERAIRVRPTHVFNNMVRFWVDPVVETLPELLRNYADGIDTGDIEYGLWTAHCYCYHLYYAGVSLQRTGSEIAGMVQAMRHHKQLAPLAVTLPFAQLVENLRVGAVKPARLVGQHVNEETAMPEHLGSNYRGAVFVLSTCMVIVRVYFRDYDDAAQIAQLYVGYRDGATATMHVASLEFYEAIAQLAGSNPDLTRGEASRDSLAYWERFNPVTFGHWRMAIDAELARLRGDVVAALDGFDAAIAHAVKHGLVGDEALLNERAALFHLERGSQRIARTYLLEARQAYERWGAVAKIAHLEQLHPESLLGTASPHANVGVGDLDLEALFRASFVLSEEIRLDRLLQKIVLVSMQNAAATRGFLIVERDGRLLVEVALDADGVELSKPGITLTGYPELATSIVQYVARTSEHLVLANAASDRRFSFDPYLQRGGPTAILCTPLVHNGRSHGIVYLENHLVTGCFTQARLKTVQVLAAQAAISIENAGLVGNLESRVAERTEALEQALQQTRVQHQQLVASQQRLVISDRLAVLGQLVAGVAHELNTPLGAIGASAANITAAVESLNQSFWHMIAHTSSEEQSSLSYLLSSASGENQVRSSREVRAAHKALAAELDQNGIADSARIAEVFVAMGITRFEPEQRAVLTSRSRDELLKAATEITSLRLGTSNIQEGAKRMSRIVFALKNYAHPAGREKRSEESLAANIDNMLTLYGHQLRAGVEVIRDYATDTTVEAVHDRLNQVWTNLVHNALQAMGTGGILTLRIQPGEDEHMIVRIEDNGPGIPKDQLSRVFDAFFTTKGPGEGSGLGLSICKDIVDAHGGTISVESTPGDTKFVVKLPMLARTRAPSSRRYS